MRFLIAAFVFATAAAAFANPFKSKIITGNDSTLVITVPDDHFIKITNFTQDGGTDRAVVEVTLQGDTENGGTTNVLTATRIDFSTGSNAQNSPEIVNRVVVAGPAMVRVRPVVGATLFIRYKKERDEGRKNEREQSVHELLQVKIAQPLAGIGRHRDRHDHMHHY